MESFAFWYHKKEESDESVSAVLNFNLWIECGWKKCCFPFLDIGFKIYNLNHASELYFFIPIVISDLSKLSCIEDLGCKFKQTELVDALFNESYATTIAANTKSIEVSNINEEDKFKIYQLDIEHDIDIERFADGTIIKIKTENIIKSRGGAEDLNDTYYMRFRIKNQDLPFLIHEYSSPNKFFQSTFSKTYMIDFRYHNVRSLDKTLIEKFSEKGNEVVPVKALHFLLMTKAYVDVTDSNFKSVRKIEQEVWKDYVDDNDTRDLVAYHYSDKSKSNEYNNAKIREYVQSSEFFAKFRVEKGLIKWYLIITVLIGLAGTILSEVIQFILERVFIS